MSDLDPRLEPVLNSVQAALTELRDLINALRSTNNSGIAVSSGSATSTTTTSSTTASTLETTGCDATVTAPTEGQVTPVRDLAELSISTPVSVTSPHSLSIQQQRLLEYAHGSTVTIPTSSAAARGLFQSPGPAPSLHVATTSEEPLRTTSTPKGVITTSDDALSSVSDLASPLSGGALSPHSASQDLIYLDRALHRAIHAPHAVVLQALRSDYSSVVTLARTVDVMRFVVSTFELDAVGYPSWDLVWIG